MGKIKSTGCHRWKAVEDFGSKSSGKVYLNCFQCREKAVYKQEKSVEKSEQTELVGHVRKLLMNDKMLEYCWV